MSRLHKTFTRKATFFHKVVKTKMVTKPNHKKKFNRSHISFKHAQVLLALAVSVLLALKIKKSSQNFHNLIAMQLQLQEKILLELPNIKLLLQLRIPYEMQAY